MGANGLGACRPDCACGKHTVRNSGQFSLANPGFKGRRHSETTKATLRAKRLVQQNLNLIGQRPLTPEERSKHFDALWTLNTVTGCHIWQGGLSSNGYGIFGLDGRKTNNAHIYADNRARGPIPPGLERDHTCNVRRCVNPDHIERVTHAENIRRGCVRRRMAA